MSVVTVRAFSVEDKSAHHSREIGRYTSCDVITSFKLVLLASCQIQQTS